MESCNIVERRHDTILVANKTLISSTKEALTIQTHTHASAHKHAEYCNKINMKNRVFFCANISRCCLCDLMRGGKGGEREKNGKRRTVKLQQDSTLTHTYTQPRDAKARRSTHTVNGKLYMGEKTPGGIKHGRGGATTTHPSFFVVFKKQHVRKKREGANNMTCEE